MSNSRTTYVLMPVIINENNETIEVSCVFCRRTHTHHYDPDIMSFGHILRLPSLTHDRLNRKDSHTQT